MAQRDEIIAFCDELLAIDRFADYGPNGLQVPGAEEVERVATGVSASRRLIEEAVGSGADLILCHHGLFWDFHPRTISPQMRDRLRPLLAREVSLAGYHLPLDAHREVGNNALLAGLLGYAPTDEEFGTAKGQAIGVVGRSEDPPTIGELVARIGEAFGREPLLQGSGPDRVERIGVLTGAGASAIAEAVDLELDALVTGEPAEHAMADAEEGGVHFLAAGHYATETLGIRRLGEIVAERFGVEHSFIEVPNPV